MPQTDPGIDDYIAKAGDFAKPILTHIRKMMHSACPTVEEGMKWSMPFFMLGGKNLANMAAFKQHAAFGFWKDIELPKAGEAMGNFGRITTLDDLPEDEELIALIRLAGERLLAGRTAAKPRPASVKVPPLPEDLASALAANVDAQGTYDKFSPSSKREYVEWVTEAKREATREKRIATAVEWMAEGKDRNWKYR